MKPEECWTAVNVATKKQEQFCKDDIPTVSNEVSPFFIRRFKIDTGTELRYCECTFAGVNTWKIFAGTNFEYELYDHQHRHNFFEIMIVLDGEVDVSIEDGIYRYQKGDVCMLNRRTRHSEIFKPGQELLYIAFTNEFLEQWPEPYAEFSNQKTSIYSFFYHNFERPSTRPKNYMDFYLEPHHSVDEALHITNAMEEELAENQVGGMLIIYALLDRLFMLLGSSSYRDVYFDLGSGSDGDVFELARNYMDNNRRKLSRKELSDAIFYNGDYINRVFMKYTKQSVREYNRYVYLKEAGRLLKSTTMSVAEVAQMVGFENRTQFNKLFQQQYGLFPGEYRKIH